MDAPRPTPDAPSLVVELGSHVDNQLRELVASEETNETMIVNRGIQVMHLLRDVRDEGGEVTIRHADGRTEVLAFVV